MNGWTYNLAAPFYFCLHLAIIPVSKLKFTMTFRELFLPQIEIAHGFFYSPVWKFEL